MKKKHFALFLIGAIIAACTTATPTTVAPSTRETGEPPETLAVDSLSFSVLGLPDEVSSYERLSIGVASIIPECRFELDAPELLWIETDDQVNFEFNAPIVYQLSEEFSIGIRSIENSDCPSQTETINLKVNQGLLKYDDLPLNTNFLSTDHYQVADFGFGGLEVTETYTATICYPTPDDCVTEEDTLFGPDAHNMATGDFNNDGHEDLVVAWALFPHTIPEEEKVEAPIHIYLNDGNGRLYEDPSIYADRVPPTHPFAYRLVVADLNGDGVDDVFAGSSGIQVRFEDPTLDYIAPHPHLLLLSTGDGTFVDAAGNIDDQNQGRGLECNFAHEASGGDFDADGDTDLYACNMLLVNDGSGGFTIHPFINLEWQQQHANPMSSLVEDLNNDGYDDLIFWHFDDRWDIENRPEEGWILLSNGTADIAAWQRFELPPGPFGVNYNKYNHAASGDLDGDGFTDAVVGVTRRDPYYEGAHVQVLINDGTGRLDDQTATRFPIQPRAEAHHGEGNIYLRDLDSDGDLDIFHSLQPQESAFGESQESPFSGAHIAVNDGNGNFVSVESDHLPKKPLTFDEDATPTLGRGVPIDLDGKGCLDLISTSETWHDWFDDRPPHTRSYLFAIINIDCEGLLDQADLVMEILPVPTPVPTLSTEQFDDGYIIYSDDFASGWSLNSWDNGTANQFSDANVYQGSNAIEFMFEPGGGFSFPIGSFDASPYDYLVFYINGGETADQELYIKMNSEEGNVLGEVFYLSEGYIEGSSLQPGQWHQVALPLNLVNAEGKPISWFDMGDASGNGASAFFIDEIRFVTDGP